MSMANFPNTANHPTNTGASPAGAAKPTSGSSIPYAIPVRKRSLAQRLNIRMIAFALVVLCVVGYPVYIYLDSVVTGGIQDLGGGFKQLDLKAMSTFDLDQTNGETADVPPKWRAMDGQNVVLYGEMWEPMSAGNSDVTRFDLCYSIAKCCFNGPPLVQHFVKATVLPGRSLEYYANLVKVTGKLHVNVIHDAGKVSSVYQLDVTDIQPAT